jgi:hypothetical protein
MAKTKIEKTKGPSLEEMLLTASYAQRDQALAAVHAAIQPVLSPRTTTKVLGTDHFLATPHPPLTKLNRAGKPEPADEAAQQQFQEELTAVSLREKRLLDAAQRAKGKLPLLVEWTQELGKTEDRLLVSSLDEEDRPEAEEYLRQHQRFLRTCAKLADGLKF